MLLNEFWYDFLNLFSNKLPVTASVWTFKLCGVFQIEM